MARTGTNGIVMEYAFAADFPLVGSSGQLYLALDTDILYSWQDPSYIAVGSGSSGVTDHGALTGLSDDDHSQYYNQTRGDARYSQLGHTHTAANVTDFDTEVSNNTDVAANTSARHTHVNSAVLAATTASFLTADETKLDGIEAGADVTDATNVAAAGAFMKAVDDADDITEGITNKLMSATERTKLSGIATGATANSSDATLLNRANHTGTQTASTVSDFNTAALAAAPAETATTVGTLISGATDKATPVDADSVALSDSAASNILKKLSWSNIKATLKAYFDTLYATVGQANATHSGDVTGSGALTIDPSAITGKTTVTAVGADYILISDTSDSGNLKKALVSDLTGGGGSPAGSSNDIQFNTGGAFAADTGVFTYDTGLSKLTVPHCAAELVETVITSAFGAELDYHATSTDITLDSSNFAVGVDASGAARTMSLQSAASGYGQNTVFIVKKTDSSGNTVTLDPSGAETIDGASTYVLSAQNDAVIIQSDGTNWRVLSFYDASGGAAGLTNFTESVNTSAPNATIPSARLIATNAATNVDAVFAPKGSGAILAQIPDNTTTGGNKRGVNSVDLQMTRASAASVASGDNCFVAGDNNRATGTSSTAVGSSNTASNTSAFATGHNNTASGSRSIATGNSTTASGYAASSFGTVTIASGDYSQATGQNSSTYGTINRKSHGFHDSTTGIAQTSLFGLFTLTTNATPKVLTVDNTAAASNNTILLQNNNAFAYKGMIVARRKASEGTITAAWEIKGLIRRESNAASTVLVDSIIDTISNASGLDVSVAADTTVGALQITVTGLAATNIRWTATVDTVEVLYA